MGKTPKTPAPSGDLTTFTRDRVTQRVFRKGTGPAVIVITELPGISPQVLARVLGLRFQGDPFVPAERFAFLRERLGEGFVAVELHQQDGHSDGGLPRHHSVLTRSLIDEPGEPTCRALDPVLTLLTDRLRGAGPRGGR